jgi:hypothetical protein
MTGTQIACGKSPVLKGYDFREAQIKSDATSSISSGAKQAAEKRPGFDSSLRKASLRA